MGHEELVVQGLDSSEPREDGRTQQDQKRVDSNPKEGKGVKILEQ